MGLALTQKEVIPKLNSYPQKIFKLFILYLVLFYSLFNVIMLKDLVFSYIFYNLSYKRFKIKEIKGILK